jgi:hypothetical protein
VSGRPGAGAVLSGAAIRRAERTIEIRDKRAEGPIGGEILAETTANPEVDTQFLPVGFFSEQEE